MIVQFLPKDKAEIYALASERYYDHRKKGTYEVNKFHDQKIRADVEGILGEWAVADSLNIPRPFNNEVDPGFDIVYNGHKIDVKYTSYRTGKLLVPLNRKIKCDWLVLAVQDGKKSRVRLAGGISSKDYIEKQK